MHLHVQTTKMCFLLHLKGHFFVVELNFLIQYRYLFPGKCRRVRIR
jgi:hypothetical protein